MEPFGPRHEEARAGVLAAAAINPWRGKNKPAVKAEDIFPTLKEKQEDRDAGWWDTPEGQVTIMQMYAAMYGTAK
jgi:hypothetical protein